jgi:hypothetical protein
MWRVDRRSTGGVDGMEEGNLRSRLSLSMVDRCRTDDWVLEMLVYSMNRTISKEVDNKLLQ